MSASKEQHKLYKYYVEPQAANALTQRTLALVLAGGEGSRLKNLTKWRAKPSVYFGGKLRIIDFPLSNCVNSGIRRIGVLTQYKAHSLIRHLVRGWSHFKMELGEYIEILPASQQSSDNWYQGTADAGVRHAPGSPQHQQVEGVSHLIGAGQIEAHAAGGVDNEIAPVGSIYTYTFGPRGKMPPVTFTWAL